MPITLQAYPFQDLDTTESQYGTLFGLLQDDGIDDIPTASSGLVTAGTGFAVNIATIPGAYLSGVYAALPASGSVTLTAAAATQARIDRIVLRANSNTNIAQIDVLTGTPGSGAAPGLTQTPGGIYEISLARITVPAGSLNLLSSNIVDERPFISQYVRQYTTATRPPARNGLFGYNHTTGGLEVCVGGNWVGLLAWANITGKPSAFPPSAHTHDDLYPRLDTAGSVTQAMLPVKIFSAKLTVTPTGSYPQRTKTAVSFGGLFANTPAITVTAGTTSPDNVSVSHSDDTSTGVNVVLSRDDGNLATAVSVIAVGT